MEQRKIDDLSIATIRSLAIDIINKANSGHPGMALGSAPIVYTLFTRHLVADPLHSNWINRDRFVLSAGHASALLYSMLHLSGYKVSMDDLKSFRQLHSLTPGHPEYHHTDGVDATSGPLGQGIAQAVGLALAERTLPTLYKDGKDLCNHYTYCLCGDGCLEEGISEEAISFAGHQGLEKLILFYDSNEVTLDGGLELSNSVDVTKRFEANNWNVLEVMDGNDVEAIDQAIIQAKHLNGKPTLIIVHTIIGYGASKQGTSKVHGSPLGVEDGKRTKVEVYHFDHEDFYVPEEVREHFKNTIGKRGHEAYVKYCEMFEEYKKNHLEDANRFLELENLDVSKYLPTSAPVLEEGSQEASRKVSGKALNNLILRVPNLIGGSADVAGSVMTAIKDGVNITKETPNGRNINWGIREFFMASAQNGILLHGGLRTYVGCFLVFSDYMKNAIRMSALSKLPAIYLFSHDTIALGEDGPTHQPIEQLAMLRSIPNTTVIRPCDARETYEAWNVALRNLTGPTAIILSRQNLPLLNTSSEDGVRHGAYVVREVENADLEVISTGSEVSLAIATAEELEKENIKVRVISMPSMELFEKQDSEYKKNLFKLPYERRITLEMLTTFGWGKYGMTNIGIDTFGTSAPAKDAMQDFGFTVASLKEKFKAALK